MSFQGYTFQKQDHVFDLNFLIWENANWLHSAPRRWVFTWQTSPGWPRMWFLRQEAALSNSVGTLGCSNAIAAYRLLPGSITNHRFPRKAWESMYVWKLSVKSLSKFSIHFPYHRKMDDLLPVEITFQTQGDGAICRVYKGEDAFLWPPTSIKSVYYEVLPFACLTTNKQVGYTAG